MNIAARIWTPPAGQIPFQWISGSWFICVVFISKKFKETAVGGWNLWDEDEEKRQAEDRKIWTAPTNQSGNMWLDFYVSGRSGSASWPYWTQYIIYVCTFSLPAFQLISWLFFLPISNVVLLSPGQPIKGERASLAKPWYGGNMPTIMFMSSSHREDVLSVGGPLWQPVAARLRISPPQGQDYRRITNEQDDVI